MVILLLIVIISAISALPIIVLDANSQSVNGQIVRDRSDGLCKSLITSQGDYDCTEYMVETGDGFLLGLQRMSRHGVATKGAVFLMHGLMTGGEIWVINTPSESLGFILADDGWDVWIGNTRTTRFSYGHTTYQRYDYGFWDWSVDEMAEQDLPTMLGFIFQTLGNTIHYIGYSQGSQQAFAALSEGQLSTFLDKVIMIAPVAFIDHGTAPIELGLFDLHMDQALEASNVHEFSPRSKEGVQLVELICKGDPNCLKSWVFVFAGDNCCLNMASRNHIELYEPQSTSVKNLRHFGQQGRAANFAKYDYGLLGNLLRYQSVTPPIYQLANIPSDKLLLINGQYDALADPIDVNRLIYNIGGDVNIYTSTTFGHLDFIFSESARIEVYPKILSFLHSS